MTGDAVGVEQGQRRGLLQADTAPEHKPSLAHRPDLILTPKLCRTDGSSKVDLLNGEIVSASLDRIRDLKDQAVAVGDDRVQISRIAQALQEGEWLCVERRCLFEQHSRLRS